MLISKSHLLACSKRNLSCSASNTFTKSYTSREKAIAIRLLPQHSRFKSSATAITSKSTTESFEVGECPFHKKQNVNSIKETTKLHRIPSLPIIGSLIPQHSGLNMLELIRDPYKFYIDIRNKFGDFSSFGVPGLGKGLHGTMYVLTDPHEMHKVVRKEGSHPQGLLNFNWPVHQFLLNQQSDLADFFQRGEVWFKYRRFLQTDLLTPSSAKGYIPGMVKTAELTSSHAVHHSSDINRYMMYASFDMVASFIYGEFTRTASPTHESTPANKLNKKFCDHTTDALNNVFTLLITQPHMKLLPQFGIKSKLFKEFESHLTASRKICLDKFEHFYEKKVNGTLDEFESSSYCFRAIDRMKSNSNIEKNDIFEMIFTILSGAVDTTSSKLCWVSCVLEFVTDKFLQDFEIHCFHFFVTFQIMIHLALNPHVQEKMYEEQQRFLSTTEDGKFCAEMFSKSKIPYLHGILRESHRMTPVLVTSLTKENTSGEVEIHNEIFPKGSATFSLDSYSLGMDPSVIPDFDTFRPERWFENEIEARKGTVAEFLDHPFYSGPFSAGARKCPGYRVANFEMFVLLSQLVKDYKFALDDDKVQSWRDIEYCFGNSIVPTVPKFKFEAR